MRSSGAVFLRLEGQVGDRGWCVGDLADVSPGLLVVGDMQFVRSRVDDVALYARWVGEQHERLAETCRWRRIDHRLRRARIVVNWPDPIGWSGFNLSA